MTFYEELQLNQAGSKELIRNTQGKVAKLKHTAIYLFKIFITMIFCMFLSLLIAKSLARIIVLLGLLSYFLF